MKTGKILWVLLLAVGLVYATPSFAAKSLTFGVNPWPENVAVAHLWQQLLTARGYKVKIQVGGKAPIWAGVANGSLDLDFEAWLPNADGAYYKRFKNKLTLIGPWLPNAKEGLVVPDYMHIDSIAQLGAHQKEFVHNGGPAIVGIGAGAGVTVRTQKVIKQYQLPFKLQTSSGAAMLAELKRSYATKKPIVVTLWKPHWVWAQYKLHFLKDPRHVYGKPDSIYIFATKGFKSNYPKVTKWLSQFSLTEPQLAELMNLIRKSGTPDPAIAHWRKQHSQMIQGWFNER